MDELVLVAIGVAVAAVSAVRGIWSPCGLSMLTSINPFSERGRRHRYAITAGWFVVGSILGGASLGGGMAVLALGVRASGVSSDAALCLASLAAIAACLVDAGVLGITLPVLRRQVNERWLDQYRGWFYGLGFGWQIGSGLATYVMTAGVFATVALGALSGSPAAALGIGCAFGLVRGAGVFLSARADSPAALRSLLGTLDRREGLVRGVVIMVLLAAGVALGLSVSIPVGVAMGLLGAVGIVGSWAQRERLAR